MKNALKNREDCNVILVDWSKGAKKEYYQSAGNTQLVGAQVGELIRFLISSAGGSRNLVDKFYVIGFSLGAQAAGYAGTYLKDKARMTLGRITGTSGKKKILHTMDYIKFPLPFPAKFLLLNGNDHGQKIQDSLIKTKPHAEALRNMGNTLFEM